MAEIVTRDCDPLQRWKAYPDVPRHTYGAFSGVPLASLPKQPLAYGYSYSATVEAECRDLTRAAENALREERAFHASGRGGSRNRELRAQ